MNKKRLILIIAFAVVGYGVYLAYSVIFRAEEILESELSDQETIAYQELQARSQEVSFSVLIPREIPEGYHLVHKPAYASIRSNQGFNGEDQITFYYEHPRSVLVEIKQNKLSVGDVEQKIVCESDERAKITLKNNTSACLGYFAGREVTDGPDFLANIQLDYHFNGLRISLIQTNKQYSVDASLLSKEEVIAFAEAMIE